MKGKNKVCRKVSKTFSDDSRQLHRLLAIKFLTLLNFPSETQKGHDFSSCSAKPRAGSTQTKLQASQTKQFITTIVTHMPRFVCMYKTPKKGQGAQVSDCYQGFLWKNNPWKSGKPQLSHPEKNSFPRKNTLSTAKQALHLSWLRLTPAALQGGSGRRWRRGADMSFWLMLQRMIRVLWVNAL